MGAGCSELLPRQALLVTWQEQAVDLIGPWKLMIGQKEIEFSTLMCNNPVTNLVKMIQVANKMAKHVDQQFEILWLARYPCSSKCIHNN
eukprot:11224328-Ditylum_brightwellii.AAC.1